MVFCSPKVLKFVVKAGQNSTTGLFHNKSNMASNATGRVKTRAEAKQKDGVVHPRPVLVLGKYTKALLPVVVFDEACSRAFRKFTPSLRYSVAQVVRGILVEGLANSLSL